MHNVNVTIRNQIMVGDNSILGLGCVVVKDVESNKVVASVPAKTINNVNYIKYYYILKIYS